jgi:hypothetical protein
MMDSHLLKIMNPVLNKRSALDARTALSFHIEAHWPGASVRER